MMSHPTQETNSFLTNRPVVLVPSGLQAYVGSGTHPFRFADESNNIVVDVHLHVVNLYSGEDVGCTRDGRPCIAKATFSLGGQATRYGVVEFTPSIITDEDGKRRCSHAHFRLVKEITKDKWSGTTLGRNVIRVCTEYSDVIFDKRYWLTTPDTDF